MYSPGKTSYVIIGGLLNLTFVLTVPGSQLRPGLVSQVLLTSVFDRLWVGALALIPYIHQRQKEARKYIAH